jgi:sirohydrochlorin cobaltochelatase
MDGMNLEARIETMLPARYRETYRDLQPVPMRSASLKYDSAGRVAWDEIWGSFCDLAMAGGPPHRGTFLEPGRLEEIAAEGEKYEAAVAELCRGIHLVTGLYARGSAKPGWIHVDCTSAAMSAWLGRAIVMENVAARFGGLSLSLPAGANYRVEKEIKNVIVAMAKTSHYWLEHMSDEQHGEIGKLLRTMQRESPLLSPLYECNGFAKERQEAYARQVAAMVSDATGLQTSCDHSGRWLGFDCGDLSRAVQRMRVFAVKNTIVRREGTIVYLPLNPVLDSSGDRIVQHIEAANIEQVQ